MGSFNDWVRGTSLETIEKRNVVTVAEQLLEGAAFLYRIVDLNLQGFSVPPSWNKYLI
jgi:hypothetical protein